MSFSCFSFCCSRRAVGSVPQPTPTLTPISPRASTYEAPTASGTRGSSTELSLPIAPPASSFKPMSVSSSPNKHILTLLTPTFLSGKHDILEILNSVSSLPEPFAKKLFIDFCNHSLGNIRQSITRGSSITSRRDDVVGLFERMDAYIPKKDSYEEIWTESGQNFDAAMIAVQTQLNNGLNRIERSLEGLFFASSRVIGEEGGSALSIGALASPEAHSDDLSTSEAQRCFRNILAFTVPH